MIPGSSSSAHLRPRHRGFTLVELLVVTMIFLLLLSIFVPFVRKSRETDYRVRCQSNLRALGLALSRYATANQGTFPRVVYDSANYPNGYFAFTGPFAPNPFAGDGRVSANDVTASLWLLVRGGYASPDVFVCPSTSDYADVLADSTPGEAIPAGQRSNFRRARNLSYSYACPFGSAPGYKFNEYLPADFVLLADKNPGKGPASDVTGPTYEAPPLALARANSNNHQRAGQSVLYADMHVEFRTNPYCGFGYYSTGSAGDNIYTVLAARPLPEAPAPLMTSQGLVGPQYSPAWKADSYLVPTAAEDRQPN